MWPFNYQSSRVYFKNQNRKISQNPLPNNDLLTLDPEMINSVSVLSKLGNSDHNMLLWDLQLKPALTLFSRQCFDYAKADFTAVRRALAETDWSCLLQGDANEKWCIFHALLKDFETKYIPLKKHSANRRKAPWLTYKAVSLIKRKHKLHKKYKNERHPAYMKAVREAETEIRRAKRNFEKKLAENIDKDRKSFYAYVRNRSRARSTVGPLVDGQGNTLNVSQDLADSFNNYSASVFTTEDVSILPSADKSVSRYQCSETDKYRHQ